MTLYRMGAGYRVGIAGCGRIAWAHAMGWAADSRVSVAAVADPAAAARDGIAEAFALDSDHRYADYREMCREEELDFLSICLWPAEHLDASAMAVDAGVKLILCEKPLAPDLGAAKAMLDIAAASDCKLAVSHQRRHYLAWERAAALIAAGEIGTPSHARTTVTGGLLSNGTHAVDLLRYLLGDQDIVRIFGTVQRDTERYERGLPAEDCGLCAIEFEGGLVAFLDSDFGQDRQITANALIFGDGGALEVVEDSFRQFGSSDGERVFAGDAEADPAWSDVAEEHLQGAMRNLGTFMPPEHRKPLLRAFLSQARDLVDWYEDPSRSYRADGRVGYASLEATCGIFESARLRSAVDLPLAVRENPLQAMLKAGDLPPRFPGKYDIRNPRASLRQIGVGEKGVRAR